jgi:type II secretory pathway component HofQ
MSRRTLGWITGCLILVLGVGLYTVRGQEPAKQPKADDNAAKNKRLVYVVKYGAAKDLAGVLDKHFKGAAEVQVLADSPSNCLLINAPPAAFQEAVKLLGQIDRRPQMVAVEVLIIEAMPKKPDGGQPGRGEKELDEKEFTGPMDEVANKVEALRKKGLLGGVKRLQLTGVENQRATTNVGELVPQVTGVTRAAVGRVVKQIVYRSTGTEFQVTPRVGPDKTILLDLTVNDSRLRVPEDGVELGKDDNGAPILAAEIVTAVLQAKLSVPSGQAVLAKEVKTTSKSGQTQTLVIVAARVVEPEAKGNK